VKPASTNAVLVRRVRAGRALDSRTVAGRASKILACLGLRGAELSIVLCDDAFIRELNRDYRGLDRSTDVLSFPQDGAADRAVAVILGDVVISLETATRRARAGRRGLLDEATALLVHGVLHLVGHDHERPDDAKKMSACAARLEKAIKSQNRY
jgi:probable rRNA maturation factor